MNNSVFCCITFGSVIGKSGDDAEQMEILGERNSFDTSEGCGAKECRRYFLKSCCTRLLSI